MKRIGYRQNDFASACFNAVSDILLQCTNFFCKRSSSKPCRRRILAVGTLHHASATATMQPANSLFALFFTLLTRLRP